MIQVHYFNQMKVRRQTLSYDRNCFHVFIGTTYQEPAYEEGNQVEHIRKWMEKNYPGMKLIYASVPVKTYRFPGPPRVQCLIYSNGELK